MIRNDRAHLSIATQTHAGMTGKNNEDRYAVTSYQLSESDATPVVFAVVADGIGGHRAGEVAAELAVNHISQAVAESDAHHPKKILEKAIQEASNAIADHASSTPEQQGMGATCACVWVIGNQLYTASVGDSRIYLLREGRAQQLTTDHTWIQEALEKNLITHDYARDHPNIHVIRRYLGSPEPSEVDFRLRLYDSETDALAEGNQGMPLYPGDTLLICSDGLTDLVWNDEIGEIIRTKGNLKTAAQGLIDTANQRGGHDNITVVLIAVPRDLKWTPVKKRNWLPWIIGGILALVFSIVFASVLTINLLRSSGVVTATATSAATTAFSATSIPVTTALPTQAATASSVPSDTVPPPTQEPTYTPWPTNTVIPSGTQTLQ
ncbi:MAG: serine/threonine-protein phosphatase [Anaerolineales bacterium]|nr:serine/threonine-protein phosphatase [Anaerolineales bacterium]